MPEGELSQKNIVPGRQIATHLVAKPGGISARVLCDIVRRGSDPEERKIMRNQVAFKGWQSLSGGNLVAVGTVTTPCGQRRMVTLVVGEHEAGPEEKIVRLEDGSGASFALNGEAVLGGGLDGCRIRSAGCEIISAFIIRGYGWTPRTGTVTHLGPFIANHSPLTKEDRQRREEKKKRKKKERRRRI